MITVVRAGPLTTVQDLGRPGYAHLGVPRSGALDPAAARLANALAGNDASAAVLETTLLGCALRFSSPARVAVTGAAAELRVDGTMVSADADLPVVDGRPVRSATARGVPVLDLPAGAVLEVGRATAGVRSYVAVAGGVAVAEVLGSRSTDTLSGLGPPVLRDGMTLPVGVARGGAATDLDVPRLPGAEGIELGVWRGPRDDWFAGGQELFCTAYRLSPVSNRIGARLAGPSLTRAKAGELAPEGIVLGAIQVPPDGLPLIFLADHPTTGGYPVIGVVDDVTPLAQARPGTIVRFRDLDRPQRRPG